MLFDSHCHLNHPQFEKNYSDIITDCLSKKIGVFIIGNNFATSRRAVEIAEEFVGSPVFATIGVHPDDFETEGFDQEQFQLLITDKVKAIGEIGLDYFEQHGLKDKNKQQQGFVSQLKFAKKNNLPIVLHARGSQTNSEDAYLDMLDILKDFKLSGVIHCFSSTEKIAKQFLSLGFLIGFTGIITFSNKSADPLRQVVKSVSLAKILAETDAPFLAPEPHRGELCLPQHAELVAAKIAELKGIDVDQVKSQTTSNFEKLFNC